MAAPSVADCPPELLLSMLNLLPLADLVSASRVCKLWSVLAEPFIFAQVDMTWIGERPPRFSLLLRSILDRRELGRHVRRLRLGGEKYRTRHSLSVDPPALAVDVLPLSKASEVVHSTGVPQAQLWLDELQRGSADALVALLVSMLPNLESLYLGRDFTIGSQLLGRVLRVALCEPSSDLRLAAFQSLSQIKYSTRCRYYDHRRVCNAADVLPFFYAPRIQRLSVSIDNPPHFAWPTDAPTPCSLVSLELFRLRESRLGPILSALHGLRELRWVCFHNPDLDRGVSLDVIQLDTVAEALSHVGDSLIDLTITAEAEPGSGDLEPPWMHLRGSLRRLADLTQLTRLNIPWVFLMGYSPASAMQLGDGLPRSLELLTLSDDLWDQWDMWDHREVEWNDVTVIRSVRSGLLRRTRPPLANLRRIMLPMPQFLGEMTQELKTELGEISALAGVQLEWDDSPPYSGQ